MKTDKKQPKTPKRVILVRIMAAFLGLLMLLGVFAMALPLTSYAAESQYQFTDDMIRVGLMYGSNITVGFEITTEYGFEFGLLKDGENYIPLYQVTDTMISVTCDANLSKKAMTYSIGSASNAVIGGWHAQVTTDAVNLVATLAQIQNIAETFGWDAFPAYIQDTYVIRVGDFVTQTEAEQAATLLTQNLGTLFSAVSNTNTAVSVVNPNTDVILFEFDDDYDTFGVMAVQGEHEAYIVTPAKNKYHGVFEFTRYISSNANGVAVTNVLPLETYVAGVVPWEINPTWPVETLKAFAVTVRTFTLSMLGRHNTSYGFDVCNGTHCQAYLGCARTTDDVQSAVDSTKGIVLTYNGSIAKTYYSSSMGGVTVSATEAWGGTGNYPYLQAVYTPWENYKEHAYGSWTAEVTPKELADELRSANYSQIKGDIQTVKINKLAENSSYVYSITFTDTYGNTATIERTDKIRSTFSFLKSANFVVGKAGDTLQITEYVFVDEPEADGNPIQSDELAEETIISEKNDASETSYSAVVTANGILSSGSEVYFAVNSLGMTYIDNSKPVATVTSQGNNSVVLLSSLDLNHTEKNDTELSTEISGAVMGEITTTTISVKAEGDEGNFIFIGRGYGHGVGLSQWGAHDMAELGFLWDDILKAYFPGTQLVDYQSILAKTESN